MPILNPLDFFRNRNKTPEHFDGVKEVIFLDWDRNPPLFKTRVVEPRQPGDGPAMVANVLPLKDNMSMSIRLYWKPIGSRTVPCNGSKQVLTKRWRTSLQTELSVEIQRELESKLEVKGIGALTSKLTATLGFSFTVAHEEETTEETTITPPPTGTVSHEWFQPIVVVRIITPGKVREFKNGLPDIIERTTRTMQPMCIPQPGTENFMPGEQILDGLPLEAIPGLDAGKAKILKAMEVDSPLKLGAASPSRLMAMGLTEVEATGLVNTALKLIGAEVLRVYPSKLP